MTMPPLNLPYIIAAAAPLLVVLYLMIGRNWGSSKAGPAGWIASVLIAVVLFGSNVQLLLVAFGRALMLALFVLYIIWMALLLYHVVNEAGAIKVIGDELPGLARDRPAQALLLGWVFGSFLQGASGFGVPAAVVAPLLVGLGFAANAAVVIALVGHAWAVTFGSLGSSFFSLIAATGLPGKDLAGPSALLLGISCLLCGLAVLWESGRWPALRSRWLQLLGVGLVMASVQYGLAIAGLWSLAAMGAGLAGLFVIVLDLHFRVSERITSRHLDEEDLGDGSGKAASPSQDTAAIPTTLRRRRLAKSLVPYGLLILIIVFGQLVLAQSLSTVNLSIEFQEVSTRQGWVTPAGPGRSISLLGHAGALLLYTSLLSYLWFRWQGPLEPVSGYSLGRIARKTIRGSVKSTVGIIFLVAMAVTMQQAAMTRLLAEALSAGTGPVFPLLSPFIGVVGAFMTGSNTNSNVVFGQLQLDTALALGLAAALVLAAQTTGGAIGSLFAPAKVVVGGSTVEGAEDGQVLKRAAIYGIAMTAVIALIVWLVANANS
jgi:lactate permease